MKTRYVASEFLDTGEWRLLSYLINKNDVKNFIRTHKNKHKVLSIYDNRTSRTIDIENFGKTGLKYWSDTKWLLAWFLPIMVIFSILSVLAEHAGWIFLNTGFWIVLAYAAGDFRGRYRK